MAIFRTIGLLSILKKKEVSKIKKAAARLFPGKVAEGEGGGGHRAHSPVIWG